ncbi:MAG: efflux RND transporter periplasmic adaptor subunit [Terriglobia bacterium]
MKPNDFIRRAGRLRSPAAARLAGGAILVLCLAPGGCSQDGSKAAAQATPAPIAIPTVDTVKVISQKLNMTISLPGELRPYEVVAIYPKVTGFVQWIGVDRGSRVKQGQLLARLVAPEIVAQKAEAQAKLQSAVSSRIAAEAKLASDEGTYDRLKVASATPGVISEEELEVAEKMADADRARVKALHENTVAAQATLHSVEEIESYLRVTAPFDGIITKRFVHPGALVGPSGGPGAQAPMLSIEHISRLRLVVAVPELYVAGVKEGTKVNFTVPAFPSRTFAGAVARIADSLDQKTRTMPVELDVWNPDWTLDAGMFPTISWPVSRPHPTLFVPQSALVRTMEANFVVRVRDGKTEWVDVKPGANSGSLTEVFGDLHEGDEVALHGSEELRPNTTVTPHLVKAN